MLENFITYVLFFVIKMFHKIPLKDLLFVWSVFALLLSFLGLLGALTSGAGSYTSTVKSIEGREFLFVLLDRTEFNDWLGLKEWHDWSSQLCGQFAFFFGGFTLTQLAILMDGEEDQLVLVLLQALNILLTRLNRLVAATTINSDSDGTCESSS